VKKLVDDALGLVARARGSERLRAYLQERQALILAAGAVMLIVGLACAAGVATFLAGLSPWMALPGLVLGALSVAASVAAQAYLFFSWLEGRALAKALGHRVDLGPVPAIPWPLVSTVVFLPLVLLALAAPVSAVVIVLIGAATPILFARLESQLPQRPEPDEVDP